MKILLVIFMLFTIVSVPAAAEIYKCTDTSGKTHYGDKPCKGESIIFRPRAGSDVDENAAERSDKTQRLLRAYRDEHAQERKRVADLKSEKKEREQNCYRARNSYQRVIEAGRIYEIDKDGNHIDFTDQERADVIAKEKAAVEKWCR